MNRRNKWAECGKIAKILGCTKNDVFYKLYDDLFDNGLILDLLMGCNATIARAKSLESWERLIESKRPVETPAETLKLALWYIDKCGSYEAALKAVQVAGGMVKEFNKIEA